MAICVGATDFIGGAAGALDAYDGASFSAGDGATVFKNGQFIPYVFTSSSLTENSPWIIQPDTNGTGVRWIAVEDSNLNIIRSNLTLYIANSGNDTTGNGTSGSKWKTLTKAIDWLNDKQIISGATVTIDVDSSTIAHTAVVLISGPQFRRVEIEGNGSTNSILSWSAAGTGGIKLDSSTSLKDLRDIKLLGDGTNGRGIEINHGSTLQITADVLVDSFNVGVFLDRDSYLDVTSGALSSTGNNAQGISLNNESSCLVQSCTFSSNGTTGCYATQNSTINAASATASSNGTYGFFCSFNSFIHANGSTAVSNGTSNYSPAKATAGDPTFANQGSWIYG